MKRPEYLVGLRTAELTPVTRVDGTKGGYACCRCGHDTALAPSGQRNLIAYSMKVMCLQCVPSGATQFVHPDSVREMRNHQKLRASRN